MNQKSKLDTKDKKILKELYADGRMLISKISSKTNIQRDSVKYRLKKLKKGTIESLKPILNYGSLGYPILYRVDINLQNYNLLIEEKFINFLKEYPNVLYIENITGKFDLSVTIAARDNGDFYKILRQIRSEYPDVMRDHEISTINKIIKFWDYTKLI